MSLKKDRFFNLKYMGFCMSQMPPDGAEVEFDDFVRFAKFQLCRASNRIMKDSIWDQYSDEEILMEYYAILFEKSDEERSKFEALLAGQDLDAVSWFDKMIEKNKEELEEQQRTLDSSEEFSFSPESLGD